MKRRWLLVPLLAFALLTQDAAAYKIGSAHITSNTTTTMITGVTGTTISVISGSLCVDNGGVATNVTIQDSASTNLLGTNVVYALGAGTCVVFKRSDKNHGPYFVVTSGLSLQVVTSANGPVEAYFEVVQQ